MVELTRLQAKLALIEGNMDKAQELLNNAKTNSLNKGMGRIVNKINMDLEVLSSQFNSWQLIINSNPTLRTRVEKSHLENYIESVVKIIENETEIQ
ncbi:MAG: hypothetical protein HeimC3_35470 [Candidatus Heimdallarchaeota archaeon LC_3]|nr:MAG: hypothetical protein HeimC3_35470 [Candidatus Heimdallarchaeota archaeon LC_3]